MNDKITNPIVSVVIPTYNRAAFLQRAIQSVLHQTYQHFEILVIDDGSTDETEEVVNRFQDARIRYLKLEENTRGRKARNVGIKESRGQWIAFLDSDDTWLPKKLEHQLSDIASTDEPLLCFTNVIIKTNLRTKRTKNKQLSKDVDMMEYILADFNTVQTSTYLIEAKLAQKVLFDDQCEKHQDWDFCLRLQRAGATFLFCQSTDTVWNCQQRTDRISVNKQTFELSKSWLLRNKNKLTKRAQLGFQQQIFMLEYMQSNQYRELFQLVLEAKKHHCFSHTLFIKRAILVAINLLRKKGGKTTETSEANI